jgi:hypothetical protein
MSVHLSVLGIVLAAVSAMVIGTLWYSSALFGKPWMKIIGLSEKEMKKRVGSAMVGLIVVSFVTAIVMSYFIAYTHSFVGGSWLKAGAITSLLAWLGFASTTIFAHGLFEPRDKKVLYINTGNRLVTLFVMGLILGALMK